MKSELCQRKARGFTSKKEGEGSLRRGANSNCLMRWRGRGIKEV